ncbi:GNAT family N-acetyltransferase [bacterium]|nr:GNAT family N-acetyltransferase [bacterium]
MPTSPNSLLPLEHVSLPLTPLPLAPVTLTGRLIDLLPMTRKHLDEVTALGADSSIWTHYLTPYDTPERMAAYFEQCAAEEAQGVAQAFVIRVRETGRLAGGTRYMNVDRANQRLEIGSSWLHPDYQRTGINTEAKYLLLCHAFDTLGALRVELKTDAWNTQSRRAMERIGAQFEGTFRYHMIRHDGRIRHSAYYAYRAPGLADDEDAH